MIDRRQAVAITLAAPWALGAAAKPHGRAALQAWTERAVAQFALPGAITAVRLPGGKVLAAAAGYADVENRRPMRIEDRLLGASIGKTFVSALCMRLQREGVFKLDDPISAWLGRETWFPRLPNGPDITLRNLMNHSSGLHDYVDEPGYAAARGGHVGEDWAMPTETKIGLVLDVPPLFPVGMGYKYSDTNYIILGVCIERATGQDYYDLIDRYFLKPRGLVRTSPSNARRLRDLAVGYTVPGTRFDRFGMPHRVVQDGQLVYNPATEWTGGGLITNPIDLVDWIHSLFDGRSISRDDIAELERPAVRGDAQHAQYHGAGFKVIASPLGKLVGHWGSMIGYSGFVAHIPSIDVAIAMQANVTSFDLLAAETSLANAASTMANRKVRT